MNKQREYISSIANYLDVDEKDIHVYWKGRVALFALLKAMGLKSGDEVIIPAFTCVVVPNAVIYLGATPKYVDVDPTTLNTTLENIKAQVTENTRFIIIQNTFGLSSQVEEIVAFGKEKNILTIEDCTHGFGGTYNGRKNGTFCDAAFYSTQWNKPFSTGIGGISLLQNSEYRKNLNAVVEQLESPNKKDKVVLSALLKVKKYLLNDTTYWTALKIYRKLSKSGAVVGSSEDVEITSTQKPDSYFMNSTNVQNKEGIKQLRKLDKVLEQRKLNGLIFNEFFRNNGSWYYQKSDLENHAFLKFPIFVKDKVKFQQLAEQAKVRLGDWFVSPIHPVLDSFEEWCLDIDKFPIAEKLSDHILNLTTEEQNIPKTLKFLEDNKSEFLKYEELVEQ